MRRSLPITSLLLLALFCGCHIEHGIAGSGVRKSEQRELASFKAIETTGAYELEVTCQAPARLEIEADDNFLPLIQTDVRDGVLYVKSEKKLDTRKPILLRISLPSLERVKSTGAGKFHVTNIKSDKFAIDSTGASAVTATGETQTVDIRSTGAGKVDATALRAKKAEVHSSGIASIDVNASDELDVNVSGAGRVTYSGDPKVTKSVSGAGVVSKRD